MARRLRAPGGRRGWRLTTRATALLAALAVAALAGCERAPEPGPGQAARPLVVATVYPLYEFARQVGGDRVEVVALVPPGVEPHDWEPSPRDVSRIQQARVFVYNGVGLEPWADRLRGDALRPDAVVVRATEGIPLASANAGNDGHGHASGATADPHVWLDPVLAQAQVERIRAGLAAADPAGAAAYEVGARSYTEVLARLHAEFQQGLADCARRDLVVSHAAFGYLARRYRLRQHAVLGLAPGAEPSPAEMAEIVRFARRHGVTHIFTETLVSSRLAETLAREVGARTLVLDPLEGLTPGALAAGQDYVTVMRANLANLREGLGCR